MPISESPMNHCHLSLGLLLRIINTTWSLPLILQERVRIMTSWLLVSKNWSRLTAQAALKNVYVPNEAYYHWHQNFIKEGCPIFDEEMRCHAQENCYSITFAHEDSVKQPSHRYPRFDAVPYLREGHLDVLTGLREVGVNYINSMPRFLDRDWWIYFVPEQVHTIRLLHITDETRTKIDENFRIVRMHTLWPTYHYTREITGVRTLHVCGMESPECFAAAAVFPNLATLWLDGKKISTARTIDPDAFQKFRALPESGPEREEGIEAFAAHLMRVICITIEEPASDRLEEILKVFAKQAPEEFAKETMRILRENPKF